MIYYVDMSRDEIGTGNILDENQENKLYLTVINLKYMTEEVIHHDLIFENKKDARHELFSHLQKKFDRLKYELELTREKLSKAFLDD